MALTDQTFGFYILTVTLIGIGAHKELGAQIRAMGGKKPFICTDKGITQAGITVQIVELIKKEVKLDPVVFDDTHPNPTDKNVHDGLLHSRLIRPPVMQSLEDGL